MIDIVVLTFWAGWFHPSQSANPTPRPAAIWRGPDVKVLTYKLGTWRIRVKRDRFIGTTTCVVWSPNVTVTHGLARFALGDNVDTTGALLRIDQAQPEAAANFAVRAAGLGAQFQAADLRNPSGGRVFVPLTDLRVGASWPQQVSIQPGSSVQHRYFDLTGLGAAFAAAQNQGCDLDAVNNRPSTQ